MVLVPRNKKAFLDWASSAATVIIVLVGIVIRLHYANQHFLEYDGYWCIFAAQHDNWYNFFSETVGTSNPLLLQFFLRAALWFGHTPLVYRLFSLFFGIASVWLVALIAKKMSHRWFAGPLAAAVFALSYASIDISLDVRGYSASTFFVLLAFYFYVDLVDSRPVRFMNRKRMGFTIASILAISLNYSAFFFVATCFVAPLPILLFNSTYRNCFGTLWRERWAGHTISFMLVVLTMIGLAITNHLMSANIIHLQPFLYIKGGSESVSAFLWRNLQTEFIYLSDWSPVVSDGYKRVLIISPLFLVLLIYVCWLRPERRSIRPGIPSAFFIVILGGIAFAAIASKYPFGGYIRHQFILFPFLVLSAVCFLDQIVFRVSRIWFRELLAMIVIVGFTANSIYELQKFEVLEEKLFKSEVADFYEVIPQPQGIYVDHFSLIAFFIHHDDWKWRFVARYKDNSWIDRYEISKNEKLLTVCRDKLVWNVDFTKASLYRYIRQCLSNCNLPSIAVFCIFQTPKPMAKRAELLFRNEILRLAAESDLTVGNLVVRESHVFGEFAFDAHRAKGSRYSQ